MVKQFAGKLKEAQEIYLKVLGINKFNIRAYYGLYMLDTNFINNDIFQNLIKIKNYNKLNLYDKELINFLLSKKEKKLVFSKLP